MKFISISIILLISIVLIGSDFIETIDQNENSIANKNIEIVRKEFFEKNKANENEDEDEEDAEEEEEEEDYDDKDYNESISSHFLRLLFNVNLLRQKIQDELLDFALNDHDDLDRNDFSRSHSSGLRLILQKINQPIHSIAMIGLKIFGSNLSDECDEVLEKFLNDIKAEKLWPYRMLDSSGLLPNPGLSIGPIVNLGAFDSCLEIVIDDRDGNFQGKYCLIESITKHLNHSIDGIVFKKKITKFTWTENIWSEFERNERFIASNRWLFSVCLPSKCSQKDLQILIDEIVSQKKISDTKKTIKVIGCQTRKEIDSNWIRTICSYLISILLIALILFNWYQNCERNSNSLARSNNSLLLILNSLQLLNLIPILFWQTYNFTRKDAMIQSMPMSDYYNQLSSVQILNFGWPSIRFFLLFNALYHSTIIALRMQQQSENSDRKPLMLSKLIAIHLLERWLSIASMFIVLIVFGPIFGNGPRYLDLIDRRLDQCSKNWYKFFLFFANDFDSFRCLPHIWIVSIEMQLYFLLIPICWFALNRIAPSIKNLWLFLGLVMLCDSIVSFLYYFLNEIGLNHLSNGLIESEAKLLEEIHSWNANIWINFTPYLLGTLIGFTLISVRYEINSKSQPIVWFSFITFLPILLIAMIAIHTDESHLETSLVLGFSRLLYSLWIMIVINFLVIIKKIPKKIHRKPRETSSKIDICKENSINSIISNWYLYNYLVILIRDSHRRQPLLFNQQKIFEEFVLNSSISLLLAYLIEISLMQSFHKFIKKILLDQQENDLDHHHHNQEDGIVESSMMIMMMRKSNNQQADINQNQTII